jgi:polysaccharide export outer membrane protein
MKRTWLFLASGVMAVFLFGCKTTTGPRLDLSPSGLSAVQNLANVNVTNRLDPAWLQPPPEPFTLGPGDRLEVEVLGDAASRTTLVVGPDGKIYYQLLRGLNVWGSTLVQTKALLERELLKYYREQPQVAITLRGVESKQVWLLGRLTAPGIYPLTSPLTLLEAISLAGGPAAAVGSATEDSADLPRSFVIRHGQLLPVDCQRLLRQGDMTQNIYLQPGDWVCLPSAKAREVYVLGAVGQPKAVNLNRRTTLISAIADAGGTIKDAHLESVAIVRGSLSEPQIALVDLRAIVRGQAPDVTLESRDIVFVPITPYRTVSRYVELILNTFARSVGANAGVKAVDPNASTLGAFIPIGR